MALFKRSMAALAAAAALWLGGASWCEGETVQLSSLQVANIQQETGQAQADKSVGGNGLSIGGQKFEHGIGTQAPSKIILVLKGGSEKFSAMVGIDDEVKGKEGGTAVFTVYGDSKRLWPQERGRSVKAGDAPQKVEVDVKGVRALVLEVSGGRDGVVNDHADWADAKIEFSGEKPLIMATPKEEPYILTPKAPATPRINGARVFGVRPGHPFQYIIAATGDRPMEFAADGLPAGLKLDAKTGIITGVVEAKSEHAVTLHAKNSQGEAQRALKIVVGDQINLTPQMGWNSWNCFAHDVTAEKVKAAADAMVDKGLINHGWTYVNIDDFWEMNPGRKQDPTLQGEPRKPDGRINPNQRFPDMKGLTDYIHGKGLKTGLYSSPGPLTCGGCIGSFEHEELDAKQWAEWGFDYIKYDWCSYDQKAKRVNGQIPLEEHKKPYQVLQAALAKVDRDIIYSLCQYGMADVGEWGAEVGGNSWRTTGDITDTWQSLSVIWSMQAGREKFAAPGHWNDPDMLIVGWVGWGPRLHPTRLTPNEQYTHISAWSLLAAPLLIGCDMTRLDDFTLNLLTNDEVLEVNQDPLGKQAARLVQDGDFEVWAKDMEDGSKAVGIFNKGELEGGYTLKFADLKVQGKQTARDLWRQKDIGDFDGQFETTVPRHGVTLIRLRPAK